MKFILKDRKATNMLKILIKNFNHYLLDINMYENI